MADYDSSLPIRTEAAGDVDVFISDATTPSQKLKVNADGSIDASFAPGTQVEITDGTDVLEINPDGSISAVVTATDLDIRNLVFADDKVDISNSTNVGVTATDLDIRNLVFATDSVDVSGSSVTVTAADLDIRDLTAASDSVAAHLFDEAGSAFSLTNPLPVEMVSDASGDEICDYNTTAAVAKNASTNHDYTVTAAKTFLAHSIWASGSGKIKVEVLSNGVTIFVGFNSTANPNIEIPIGKMCKTAATQVVRITITNLDNQAQDLYSTLTGLEV